MYVKLREVIVKVTSKSRIPIFLFPVYRSNKRRWDGWLPLTCGGYKGTDVEVE